MTLTSSLIAGLDTVTFAGQVLTAPAMFSFAPPVLCVFLLLLLPLFGPGKRKKSKTEENIFSPVRMFHCNIKMDYILLFLFSIQNEKNIYL